MGKETAIDKLKNNKNKPKTYTELPIYNFLRKLYIDLEKYTEKTQKHKKYIHVYPRLADIEDMMCDIYNIHNRDKDSSLSSADQLVNKLNNLKIHIRNLNELSILSDKSFGPISDTIEIISRQLYGWRKSKVNKNEHDSTSESI